MARAEAYLHAKFHLDPSERLATIHQSYRQTDRQTGQTGQDKQRSDSIGRTVLQTVAPKMPDHSGKMTKSSHRDRNFSCVDICVKSVTCSTYLVNAALILLNATVSSGRLQYPVSLSAGSNSQ